MKALLVLLLGIGWLFPSFGVSTNGIASGSSQHLLSRFYRIDPDTFLGNLMKAAPPESGESNQHLLMRFFEEDHILVKETSAVLLDEERRVLRVTTTDADQERIERFLVQKKLLRRNG